VEHVLAASCPTKSEECLPRRRLLLEESLTPRWNSFGNASKPSDPTLGVRVSLGAHRGPWCSMPIKEVPSQSSKSGCKNCLIPVPTGQIDRKCPHCVIGRGMILECSPEVSWIWIRCNECFAVWATHKDLGPTDERHGTE
jgi:hypothetical protein